MPSASQWYRAVHSPWNVHTAILYVWPKVEEKSDQRSWKQETGRETETTINAEQEDSLELTTRIFCLFLEYFLEGIRLVISVSVCLLTRKSASFDKKSQFVYF